MRQWEYCQVDLLGNTSSLAYYGRSGPIRRTKVNYEDVMVRLGVSDWELVGVAAYAYSTTYTKLYFKRPIQAGRAIDDAL